MKSLLLLTIVTLFFASANAQNNNRWMYLSNDDGTAFMVDTLKNDIKQLESYDGHINVVMIWVKTMQTKSNKKNSFIESTISRFVIDTAINQFEVTSGAVYHDNRQIQSGNNNYLPWRDAVPETGADILISYCRALNNQRLMQMFIANAESQKGKSPIRLKKKKSNR